MPCEHFLKHQPHLYITKVFTWPTFIELTSVCSLKKKKLQKKERNNSMGCKLYLKEKMNSIAKASNINYTLLKTKGTLPDIFLQGWWDQCQLAMTQTVFSCLWHISHILTTEKSWGIKKKANDKIVNEPHVQSTGML